MHVNTSLTIALVSWAALLTLMVRYREDLWPVASLLLCATVVYLYVARPFTVPCLCSEPPFFAKCEPGGAPGSQACKAFAATSDALGNVVASIYSPNTWTQYPMDTIPPMPTDADVPKDLPPRAREIVKGQLELEYGIKNVARGLGCIHYPEILPHFQIPWKNLPVPSVKYKEAGVIPPLDLEQHAWCDFNPGAAIAKAAKAVAHVAGDVGKAIGHAFSWI